MLPRAFSWCELPIVAIDLLIEVMHFCQQIA
jgi:hypothetical protein